MTGGEGAAAAPADEQLVVSQLYVNLGDHLARQAELLRKQARGRQLLSSCEPASANSLFQLSIDLPDQVLVVPDHTT